MDQRGPDEETGIVALLGRLIDDAEDYVRAEVELYRQEAIQRLTGSRSALAMIVIAALLGIAGSIALLLGLVVALMPLVGPLLAGIMVCAGALLVAALLFQVAIRRFRAVASRFQEK